MDSIAGLATRDSPLLWQLALLPLARDGSNRPSDGAKGPSAPAFSPSRSRLITQAVTLSARSVMAHTRVVIHGTPIARVVTRGTHSRSPAHARRPDHFLAAGSIR